MSPRSKKKAPAAPSSAPASPESEGRPAGLSDRWTVIGVCLFLAAIIWVVFGQTLGHEFFNCDDDVYVYENPVVSGGLTLKGIAAMFTHVECNFYHPLTMISLMLNDQLNGLQPGGYHLANVLLHTLSAILLFLVLRRMTGFTWRSAFVAAVFAIHPLRVESVAWVAERKDVLSGVFFMLTIGAYVRYVEKFKVQLRWGASRRPKSRVWYGLMLLSFTLGLLSKPTLVTLPFVLLLLDYWPLNRFGLSTLNSSVSAYSYGATAPTQAAPEVSPRRERSEGGQFSTKRALWLVLEKIPLFVLSAAASVMTIIAEEKAMTSPPGLSFLARMSNPIMSYVIYMRQMVYPADLAPLYPFLARDMFGWKIILAFVLLVAISAVAIAGWRKRPYLLVGWLWYLGMLVPMIGIIQISGIAHADRFTYLPMIGLSVALTWGAAELCAGWRHRRVVLGGCATVILVALIFCARTQTAYWRNSESLWTHTLACTSDNYFAHYNLGNTLFQKGNVDEAIVHYKKALQINPDSMEAHYNLGNALLQKGSVDEAIAHFQKALQIKPNDAEANNNLGNALFQKGSVDEAIVQYQKALQIEPDYAEAHNNLGNALLQKGNLDEAISHFQKALQIEPDFAEAQNNLGNALLIKDNVDEAIAHFQKALQIEPNYAKAHYNLGRALLTKGNVEEAIVQYQKALQIEPDYAKVLNNLAWVLATCPQASLRNGNKAVALAQRANQLTGDGNPVVLGTLAAAYAEAGRFPEAVETAQRALQLAETQSNTALADAIRSQLKLYQAGIPFHSH
jgi:tetratricopeptide (TPR) repeat protein